MDLGLAVGSMETAVQAIKAEVGYKREDPFSSLHHQRAAWVLSGSRPPRPSHSPWDDMVLYENGITRDLGLATASFTALGYDLTIE